MLPNVVRVHLTSENAGKALMIAGIVSIFAVCFTVIKMGLFFAPPLLFGGLRASVAGVALLGVVALLRQRVIPAAGDWPAIALLAVFSTTIGFGAMFMSPGRTGAGIASVLGNTQALIVIVLAPWLLGEPVTRVKLAALLLGMAGVSVIAYPAIAAPDAYGVTGVLLPLLAAAGAAAGTVIIKRTGCHPVLLMNAWQLILGSVPLLLLSALVEKDTTVLWTPVFAGLLGLIALPGTALAITAWYWLLQQHEDAGRLSLFLFLVPVVGLTLATLIFKEQFSAFDLAGMAITLMGVALAAMGGAGQSVGRPPVDRAVASQPTEAAAGLDTPRE
jgi:O-acetylserine/cysteine efflux transporter